MTPDSEIRSILAGVGSIDELRMTEISRLDRLAKQAGYRNIMDWAENNHMGTMDIFAPEHGRSYPSSILSVPLNDKLAAGGLVSTGLSTTISNIAAEPAKVVSEKKLEHLLQELENIQSAAYEPYALNSAAETLVAVRTRLAALRDVVKNL